MTLTWILQVKQFGINTNNILKLEELSDEELILFVSFNENVYTGHFAKRLAIDDLCMIEKCLKVKEQLLLPPTHVNGSHPIDAAFASSRIDCAEA